MIRLRNISLGLSIITLLVTILYPSSRVYADNDSSAATIIKVGLHRMFAGSNILFITCDGAFTITDEKRKNTFNGAPGGLYRFTAAGNGIELSLVSGSNEKLLGNLPYSMEIKPAEAAPLKIVKSASEEINLNNVDWHVYRGMLTVRRVDASLSVINTVDVESYIYGVLGPEIGASAPTEALKAQAVAARTYGLKNRGRFASDGFDVDDSTRSQQYSGIETESDTIINAVNATRGEVLTYEGNLIEAMFSTDCGGVTAPDETGEHPYFKAVPDNAGPDQPDYSVYSPYHDWDFRISQSKLSELLNNNPRSKVEKFVSMSLDDFDASGRIRTATVWNSDGARKTITGSQLRETIGYDAMRSTRVTLTIKSNGDYLFHGHGWGHGYGMSQVGAIAMASAPYNKNYEEILKHYYVGVKLVKYY